jgi:DNA mismatch repair protein MSH6
MLADMDTVLFFQKGKFFELYEQDADIGSQVFDLKVRVSASACGCSCDLADG